MIEADRQSPSVKAPFDWARFARFLAVGGLNTVFGYSLFAVFILIGMPTAAALAAGTVLGMLFNFKSFGTLVFGNKDARLLPRFALFYAVQYLVNLISLRWLQSLGLSALIAQLILIVPLSLASFLLMRRLVFGRPFSR